MDAVIACSFWIYAALLGLIFALDGIRERTAQERRIALLDRQTRQARLRVLRYRLDPQFLFHALNAITTRIRQGDASQAERMVEDLADFLRTTLTIDAQPRYPAMAERRPSALPPRIACPTRPKPAIIISQVDGSGTAGASDA